MTDRVKKIEEQLSSIGHLARFIESEKVHWQVLADVLLRRLVTDNEVLYVSQDEWVQAMNHPQLNILHSEDDSDWGWYLSLKSLGEGAQAKLESEEDSRRRSGAMEKPELED